MLKKWYITASCSMKHWCIWQKIIYIICHVGNKRKRQHTPWGNTFLALAESPGPSTWLWHRVNTLAVICCRDSETRLRDHVCAAGCDRMSSPPVERYPPNYDWENVTWIYHTLFIDHTSCIEHLVKKQHSQKIIVRQRWLGQFGIGFKK